MQRLNCKCVRSIKCDNKCVVSVNKSVWLCNCDTECEITVNSENRLIHLSLLI